MHRYVPLFLLAAALAGTFAHAQTTGPVVVTQDVRELMRSGDTKALFAWIDGIPPR